MEPNVIPLEVKDKCCELKRDGWGNRQIYDEYFKLLFERPQTFKTFQGQLRRWMIQRRPDKTTLEQGTYGGFIAHDATVQVSKNGDIIQAWIKQTADNSLDPEEFIQAVKGVVEPYNYISRDIANPFHALEIPLFDMHWGVAFMDHYEPVLNDILDLIHSHNWNKIVIPFGQDFFHNDSIANGVTTKGTVIEKVDMIRAVKDGQRFMYAIIDAALDCAKEVKVLYTPGNHDRSIAWMFIQVLLERYGSDVVDDSLTYRKVFTYGNSAIMVTHGDSKQATPTNLAHIFPIAFAEEFANAKIREVHAGHLHRELGFDVFGVMIRRLSSGGKVDEWTDHEDFVGTHRRFMLFEWSLDKLKSIHYV